MSADIVKVHHPGMTLRDYFAGQALAGQLLGIDTAKNFKAARAYEIADAMLAERAKKGGAL